MLHVGTNNHSNSPEEVVNGLIEIINTINEKHKNTYVVVPVSISSNHKALYMHNLIYLKKNKLNSLSLKFYIFNS